LGAVIGLAARQTIGSVIWGFVVLVTRPFTVGDWVAIGDREGRVAEITTTSTGLETETGDRAVIANHRIADVDVLNRSAAGRRRVDSEVTVERTRDLARAIETAEGALSDLDAALDSPAPVVAVTTADEGSTTLRLSVWISDPTPERATAVRSDAVVAVTAALERERIVGPESGSDDADDGVDVTDTNDGEPKSKLGTRRGEGGRP
jgi:small-conductance mechanosensitive channel